MAETLPVITAEKAGEIMEAVIARGDIAKLDPTERAKYYTRVCESMGLNPLTKPFEYITLNGKLTLYALKTATDQLRKIYGVSVVDMTEKREGDLIVVTVKVQDATGRTDMAKGALTLAGLKGEALANGIMKAETKAKRRATLSICGLGFLDETEIETIPQARVLKKDHRADYHTMLAEIDHTLDLQAWCASNAARIDALPTDWRANIATVVAAKAIDPTVASGEILADHWSDQQGQNLRNAMQPPDEPTELWADPGETPPEWQGEKWEKLGPVAQAGTLCGDKAFWRYLSNKGAPISNKDQAADYVRIACKVASRKDLATDEAAAKLWRALVADYRAWQREPEIADTPHSQQGTRDAADQRPAGEAPQETVAPAGREEMIMTQELLGVDQALGDAAKLGMAALEATWKPLRPAMKKALKAALDRRHKPVAEEVDARAGA